MTNETNAMISLKIILIFVSAAVLYFLLGAFDWPITELIRD